MTDFRALCAELVDALAEQDRCWMLINDARAALAQPEPVVLTRPDCFDFAMDFLGGTEEVEVRDYVERLESPAARAVLDAAFTLADNLDRDVTEAEMIAAALRAAADQVVPRDKYPSSDWTGKDEVRYQLLAIAAELEANK